MTLENFSAEKFATDTHLIPLHFCAAADGKVEKLHLFEYFMLTKAAMGPLRDKEMPADVSEKLQPLLEKDFPGQGEFRDELAKILTKEEMRQYGDEITAACGSQATW